MGGSGRQADDPKAAWVLSVLGVDVRRRAAGPAPGDGMDARRTAGAATTADPARVGPATGNADEVAAARGATERRLAAATLAAERERILAQLAQATDPPDAIPTQLSAIEAARQRVRDVLPPSVDAAAIVTATEALGKLKAVIEAARSAIAKRASGKSFKTDGSQFAALSGAAQLTPGQKAAIDRLIEAELRKPDADIEAIDFRAVAQAAITAVEDMAKVKPTYSNGAAASPAIVQKYEQLTALAHKSPTMKEALYELQGRAAARFQIKIVPGTDGASCSRASTARQISVSENYATSLSAAELAQTIAHEAGHAKYTPGTAATATTRTQWVNMTVRNCLIDEAEATLFNCQVRQEIIDAGGGDIGVAGAGAARYIAIYEQFKDNTITREQALDQIATSFGTSETTSTNNQNYDAYYRAWASGAAPTHLPP